MKFKTTEELKHVPFEMYARVLARAEQAEAQLAEAKAGLASNKLVIDQLAHERNDTQAALEEATARAERAVAELKAMREALERIVRCYDWGHSRLSGGHAEAEIARAALAPSPTGRRFTGPGELEKSGYTAPSPAERDG